MDGMTRRYLGLTFALCIAWGAVYLSDHSIEAEVAERRPLRALPPVEEWRSIKLSRPGWSEVKLIRAERSWVVQLNGEPPRSIDPLLRARVESLGELTALEERITTSEDAQRALGVTSVALTVTITSRDERVSRFRLGAEHLRHSTWIAPINQEDQMISGAVRVRGRVRRALDHEPQLWPDRRVGHIDHQALTEVRCERGPFNAKRRLATPSMTGVVDSSRLKIRSAWQITQRDKLWEVTLDGGAPPLLDQEVTRTFTYTLSSLRFARYLKRGELPPRWRPTHTCYWRAAEGSAEWLSLGRAPLGQGSRLSWIGLSASGAGLIPEHLGPILTPQLGPLLKRSPLPFDFATLTRVRYISSPAPLASSPHRPSWSMEKRATGWWLTAPQELPLSGRSAQAWLNVLTRDSAAARVKDASGETSGAELHLTLADREACRLLRQPSPCRLTLTQRDDAQPHQITRWLRLEDQVELSLSQAHHSALTLAPTP